MFGTGENDAETLFAATLVDRAEIHEHSSTGIVAIANAHDDDVALVALHIFEVFDKQAAEDVVFFPHIFGFETGGKGAVLLGEARQGIFNLSLLRFGKCDDPDAEFGSALE